MFSIRIWFWVTPFPPSMVKDHTFAIFNFGTLSLAVKTFRTQIFDVLEDFKYYFAMIIIEYFK